MRDRRDIRARRERGGTIRGIARDIDADRNTIRRALHPDARLDYRRPTLADRYEPAIRDVMADYPRLTVEQIGQLIEWPASRRTLSDIVARIRPLIIERQREDLEPPRTGVLAPLGRVRTGSVTAGPIKLGRIHDLEAIVTQPAHYPG